MHKVLWACFVSRGSPLLTQGRYCSTGRSSCVSVVVETAKGLRFVTLIHDADILLLHIGDYFRPRYDGPVETVEPSRKVCAQRICMSCPRIIEVVAKRQSAHLLYRLFLNSVKAPSTHFVGATSFLLACHAIGGDDRSQRCRLRDAERQSSSPTFIPLFLPSPVKSKPKRLAACATASR